MTGTYEICPGLHNCREIAEVAKLLNVSRPFVIKLLETGEIPFRKVGTHRRVRLVDVLEYRDRQDAIANAALDNMVRQAEEHGLYDQRVRPS